MLRLIASEMKYHAPLVTLGTICIIIIAVIFASGNISSQILTSGIVISAAFYELFTKSQSLGEKYGLALFYW